MNQPVVNTDLSEGAPTVATIDLGSLRHNVRIVKGTIGDSGLMAVVKADAYGHGLIPVTQVLKEEGVLRFAVGTIPEAVALRQAGVDDEILVLGGPLPEYLPLYAAHDLDITVSNKLVADAIAGHTFGDKSLGVHVKVDTGMSRLGLKPFELQEVIGHLAQVPGVRIKGIWTHLATSDEAGSPFVDSQIQRFLELTGLPASDPEIIRHIANSGGVFGWSDKVLGENSLVRMGIALYGYSPSAAVGGELDLEPVMRVTSRVTNIAVAEKGDSISYGRLWTAPHRTTIATVAAGYADGYPRTLSNKGLIGINGALYPVVGAVCMDMVMVDLGDNRRSVFLGNEAVLFGAGGPALPDVAAAAGTITYELCCRVAPRVPRIYLDQAP